jgi:hypothetical protein
LVALTRVKIFGGSANLHDLRLSAEEELDSSRRARARARRGRRDWQKDREFLEVLKNSVLEGYEDLYLQYAVVEEEIGLVSHCCSASVAAEPHGASDNTAESPLLQARDGGAAQIAVEVFWRELERVDEKFKAAVGEVVSILRLLKREAAPRKQIRNLRMSFSNPQSPNTVQYMQEGVHGGLKAALKDLYKKMFILIQVRDE